MATKAFGLFKLEEGLEIAVGAVNTDCRAHGWELDARTITMVLGERCGYDAAKDRKLTTAVYGWLTADAWTDDYDEGTRRLRILNRVIKRVRGRGY